MNYIKQLNSYWQKIEMDVTIKPTARLIYLALLQINNLSGWKANFRATFGQVLSMTGLSDVKTYYNALKQLEDGGYIKYIKSTNQYQAALFEILPIQKTEEHTDEHLSEHNTEPIQKTEEHTDERARGTTSGMPNIPKQQTLNNEDLKQEIILNEEYSRDSYFENSVLKFFGFNEIDNYDKAKILGECCRALFLAGRLEFFKRQFGAYEKLKNKDGFKHGFQKFLGQQSQRFEDGMWNSENWEQRLQEFENKERLAAEAAAARNPKPNRGIEAVVAAFSNLKRRPLNSNNLSPEYQEMFNNVKMRDYDEENTDNNTITIIKQPDKHQNDHQDKYQNSINNIGKNFK